MAYETFVTRYIARSFRTHVTYTDYLLACTYDSLFDMISVVLRAAHMRRLCEFFNEAYWVRSRGKTYEPGKKTKIPCDAVAGFEVIAPKTFDPNGLFSVHVGVAPALQLCIVLRLLTLGVYVPEEDGIIMRGQEKVLSYEWSMAGVSKILSRAAILRGSLRATRATCWQTILCRVISVPGVRLTAHGCYGGEFSIEESVCDVVRVEVVDSSVVRINGVEVRVPDGTPVHLHASYLAERARDAFVWTCE